MLSVVIRHTFRQMTFYRLKYTIPKTWHNFPHYITSLNFCDIVNDSDKRIKRKITRKQKLKNFGKYFNVIHENKAYEDTTVNVKNIMSLEPVTKSISFLNNSNTECEKEIQELTDQQFRDLLTDFIGIKFSNIEKFLLLLDEECCKRVVNWKVDTILSILDIWILIDDRFAFRSNFFNILKSLWCKQIRYCSKENLIQMVHYLGQSKISDVSSSLMEAIEKALLKHVENITIDEWGIICTGFFKTSTKLKSLELVQYVANMIKNNFQSVDSYNLISALKVIRHNDYYDEEFFQLLEGFVKSNSSNFDIVECAHILATFANSGWFNEDLFNSLEEQVVTTLDSVQRGIIPHHSTRIRLKDLARFLWALSHVGHHYKHYSFFEILTNAIRNLTSKVKGKNVHYLIDSVQSLIKMNYIKEDVIRAVLRKDVLEEMIRSGRHKPVHQLFFIDCSVRIEAPWYVTLNLTQDVLFEMHSSPLKSMYQDVAERRYVSDLTEVFQKYCKGNELFACSYVLEHIAILSIYIEAEISGNSVCLLESDTFSFNNTNMSDSKTKNRICFEVLDSSSCLRNHKHYMNGLMITKVRQLKKLNYKVVMLSPDIITKMTLMSDDVLKSYLDNIIIKVKNNSFLSVC